MIHVPYNHIDEVWVEMFLDLSSTDGVVRYNSVETLDDEWFSLERPFERKCSSKERHPEHLIIKLSGLPKSYVEHIILEVGRLNNGNEIILDDVELSADLACQHHFVIGSEKPNQISNCLWNRSQIK